MRQPSLFAEVSPANDWAQRWTGGAHSWRHRSEGGFDASRYEVAALDEAAAKRFVTTHHYSGSYPAARLRYGLYDRDGLCGVAVLSVPTSRAVLTNVFGENLVPYEEALELGRFVLADGVPANGETWFLGRAFSLAAQAGLRGLVSFADPVPRRLGDGTLLFPGHVGTIYQAANARYTGRGAARTLTVLRDGTVLNARAMSKVRQQDRGHEHVERKLVTLGARAPRAGQDMTAWLAQAVDDVGATKLRHRGNHRYVFALGTPAQRRRIAVVPVPQPFPKQPDLEAA